MSSLESNQAELKKFPIVELPPGLLDGPPRTAEIARCTLLIGDCPTLFLNFRLLFYKRMIQ